MLRLLVSTSAVRSPVEHGDGGRFSDHSLPPAPMLSTTPIAYNWFGFYIGAHGGWGFNDGAFDDGFVVGGQLGINWQFNNFVFGVEGDGSFTITATSTRWKRSAAALAWHSIASLFTEPAAPRSRTSRIRLGGRRRCRIRVHGFRIRAASNFFITTSTTKAPT